ncbi:MAG TPA: alpha-L-fucosidase [Armatimonadota bacterium]|jgi:alpha-L-fucosidase
MSTINETLPQIQAVIAHGPFTATARSLRQYSVPEWYEDAKFGIFIHWGVYSVPAFSNEWYGRFMYQEGTKEYDHHLRTYGPQAQHGYKEFIPQFTAAKFDPAQWVALFQEAGAKFVVPVAEHHDGFAMYDSDFSRWTAVQMGPKRDVIGELAAAIRAAGLVFGLSSHRAEHYWFFAPGMTFDTDVRDPDNADLYGPAQPMPDDYHDVTANPPDADFLDDWLVRSCELVEKYQPQLVWFDWWIENMAFRPYVQKFAAYYYNRGAQWGQGVALNYKYNACEEGCAVFDVERGQMQDIRPMLWQTDTSVSKTAWGYVSCDQDYKTAASLIGDLVDIVSKHGTMLLNIGPRPDGTIPEEEQEILRAIGRWLATYGDAIYATRPWTIFGEGPTEIATGAFSDCKHGVYTSADIRFTTKGDILYAIALAWPTDGKVTITTLAEGSAHYPGAIGSVELLGSDTPLRWTRTSQGLTIDLTGQQATSQAIAFRITPGA